MRCGRFGRRAVVSAALAAMAAMCVFNFVLTPYFECQLDGGSCDEHVSFMAGIYARSVSVTCLTAVAVAWRKYRGAVAVYTERNELHDAYKAPATADGRPRYVGHATFGAVVLYTSMALILPVNAFRLYRFVSDDRPVAVMVYFALMYSQNLYACLYETHFVRLFYALYTRLADLNGEMETVGEWIVDGRAQAREEPPPGGRGAGWIPYDGDDDDDDDGAGRPTCTSRRPPDSCWSTPSNGSGSGTG
ncbi:hypothetical protein AGLY_008576 [Aphis glycines]|uniref:Uncharacterized protein n=1 Tax=Aphis glycines TaxID=307491 RepID=A0A6G0TLN6_APHGL|nr:hypothetical protein AGLY_008576 [Aphis glycines]